MEIIVFKKERCDVRQSTRNKIVTFQYAGRLASLSQPGASTGILACC